MVYNVNYVALGETCRILLLECTLFQLGALKLISPHLFLLTIKEAWHILLVI